VTVPVPVPQVIADAAGLRRLLERLEREPLVALDTESNSFHAYHERVCLLQLSVPDADFVVDPLSVDVSPLGVLLASGREVVLHGADYDVRCLRREYGWSLGRLFDTMLAARRLGAPELGLGALVHSHFGVRLSKEHQRADWGRRPLPAAQLHYAALDTHFLLPLHRILSEGLRAKGAEEEARREFDRLAAVEAHARVFDPERWRKLRGARELDAPGKAVLRALWIAREDRARELDRPPFKVIPEMAMLEVARRRPSRDEELRRIPGLTPQVMERAGDLIRKVLADAAAAGPPPRGGASR
jgi:ribonuclease D